MSAAVPPESRPDSLPDQPVRTLVALADQTAVTLDQTRLPFDRIELVLRQATDCVHAIASMQVRGAPLIGAVAAFGLAFAMRETPDDAALDAAHARLLATRPTGVNLRWALDRVRARVASASPGQRWAIAWREACDIADEDVAINQGASLTAWELADAGVPCTVVADNAGGLLMRQGRVDAVIVGCDRVARNGDVANKVGTLLKALAARDAGVPFWVACPSPSIDFACPDGEAIEIETRTPRELTHITGRAADGRLCEVQLVPDGVAGFNPAFDLTPARLVDGLLTEHGMVAASVAGVRVVLRAAASAASATSAASAASATLRASS